MKRILFATVALLALPAVAAAAPYLPTYGSPNSAQFQTYRVGLDMQSVTDETNDRFTPDGDANVIGGAVTEWHGSGLDGERYELRYQKAWRPFEGQRTRALIDTPINAISVDGHTAVIAVLSGGLEFPVTENWAITPRAAYAVSQAGNYFGGDGELVSGSISSRYRVPQIGRGDLVIGNMISYTTTINKVLTSQKFFTSTHNFAYRSGVAYQFPLKSMVFGRQASLRASYTYTKLDGDPVFMNEYNEASVNLGVRNRESTAKNAFDLLRFGILYTWGQATPGFANAHYNATTLTAGYRF